MPITNITGYSDGPTVDENNAMCGFHAVITYSGTLKKKVTATARTMLIAPALLGSDGLGYAVTWLGKSPFDPGTFNVLPTNLTADAYY